MNQHILINFNVDQLILISVREHYKENNQRIEQFHRKIIKSNYQCCPHAIGQFCFVIIISKCVYYVKHQISISVQHFPIFALLLPEVCAKYLIMSLFFEKSQ